MNKTIFILLILSTSAICSDKIRESLTPAGILSKNAPFFIFTRKNKSCTLKALPELKKIIESAPTALSLTEKSALIYRKITELSKKIKDPYAIKMILWAVVPPGRLFGLPESIFIIFFSKNTNHELYQNIFRQNKLLSKRTIFSCDFCLISESENFTAEQETAVSRMNFNEIIEICEANDFTFWLNSKASLSLITALNIQPDKLYSAVELLKSGNLLIKMSSKKDSINLDIISKPYTKNKSALNCFLEKYKFSLSATSDKLTLNIQPVSKGDITSLINLIDAVAPGSYEEVSFSAAGLSAITGFDFVRDLIMDLNGSMSFQIISEAEKCCLKIKAESAPVSVISKKIPFLAYWSKFFYKRKTLDFYLKKNLPSNRWQAFDYKNNEIFSIAADRDSLTFLTNIFHKKNIVTKPQNRFMLSARLFKSGKSNTISVNCSRPEKLPRFVTSKSEFAEKLYSRFSPLVTAENLSPAEYALLMLMRAQKTYRAMQLGKYNNLAKASFQPEIKKLFSDIDAAGKPVRLINEKFKDGSFKGDYFNIKLGTIREISGKAVDFQKKCILYAFEKYEDNTVTYLITDNFSIYFKTGLPSPPKNVSEDLKKNNWAVLKK